MKRTILHYAMIAVSVMAMCISFTGCEETNPEEKPDTKTKDATSIEATIDFTYIDSFDFAFTLDGKDLTMKTSKSGNKIAFAYADDKKHVGEKVVCTVTPKSGADAYKLAPEFKLAMECSYVSGTIKENGSLDIHVIKMSTEGDITGNEDIALATLAGSISSFLTGSVEEAGK